MDIFSVLYILLPFSVAACVALKKDTFSNSDGFETQKWLFNDVLFILTGLACIQFICLLAFKIRIISAHELGIYGTIIFSFMVGGVTYFFVIKQHGMVCLLSMIYTGKIITNIFLPVILFLSYLTVVFLYAYLTHNNQIVLARTELLQHLQIFKGSILESVVYVVSLVLIAPTIEEVIYRGIFFPPFERKLGSRGAICVISFLWALTHLNINAIMSIFFIGLILGYLYKQTKSLLPGIIFHSLINLFSILIYVFEYY